MSVLNHLDVYKSQDLKGRICIVFENEGGTFSHMWLDSGRLINSHMSAENGNPNFICIGNLKKSFEKLGKEITRGD